MDTTTAMKTEIRGDKMKHTPTLIQTKVAMIREQGYPQGQPAPLYLNCKCGAKPSTDINTKIDVNCSCGKVYQYNGWIK